MFLGKTLGDSESLKIFILNSHRFLFYQLTVVIQKPVMTIKGSLLFFKVDSKTMKKCKHYLLKMISPRYADNILSKS